MLNTQATVNCPLARSGVFERRLPTMPYTREKWTAVEAITRAARLCIAVRAEMAEAAFLQKNDKSPVTIADFGAQALVCHGLSEEFPHDVIVAEEDAAELRKRENAALLDQVTLYVRRIQPNATRRNICDWIDAGSNNTARRFWTLDPIDGTKGFLRNDQYAIALALIEDGQVKLGALACPALPLDMDQPAGEIGVLFVAVRGEGAYMQPLAGGDLVPIQVAQKSNASSERFVESVEAAHGDQTSQQAIAQAVGITQAALRMDSQAKYASVARGDAALYLRLPAPNSPEYREKIWDHAAGSIIVEEAGGRVTDMRGAALDFGTSAKMNANRGVVVSNRVFHDAVIEALARPVAQHRYAGANFTRILAREGDTTSSIS
jgi:3'(2'), 5'-bisphosphate nucleotidase